MASAAEARLDATVVRIGAVVVLGTLLPMMDVSVVNVALPHIQESYEAGAHGSVAHAYASWTVPAYALAMAGVIPVTAWAGDRFGTRRAYLFGIMTFVLASGLCAVAWSMPALIAARVLQGIGGGMLLPLGMTILARAAGPERIGRLVALVGLPVLLGPILGPLLGGWLVGTAGWRAIFLVNLPLGAVALCAAARTLPRSAATARGPLDSRGLALMSPGLALFLFGVSGLADFEEHTTPVPAVALVTGAILIVSFLAHVRTSNAPLVDPRLLLRPGLRLPVLVLCLFQGSFFGALVLIPTFLQQVRGESVQTAALLLLPQGLGAMVSMPIAGALSDRLPTGRIAPVGAALVCAGLTGLAAVGSTASYPALSMVLFVMGVGMGATVAPTTIAALRSIRPGELPQGSAILTTVQQVASSAGMAVLSMCLTRLLNSGIGQDAAFAGVFTVSAALVGVTTAVAFALPFHRSQLPQPD